MTGYIEVKDRLTKYRKSKNMSAEEFCKGLSVSAEEYLRFELSGKLPVEHLIEIYKKYGHDLIGRESQESKFKETI